MLDNGNGCWNCDDWDVCEGHCKIIIERVWPDGSCNKWKPYVAPTENKRSAGDSEESPKSAEPTSSDRIPVSQEKPIAEESK